MLLIAVIPPVQKTQRHLQTIKPAIKKSDKDDSSYSLLLLSTFHRLVLIPEKFKQLQRFESSDTFYFRQRANQLAGITSDFKTDVIQWIKLIRQRICIMHYHCIILWYKVNNKVNKVIKARFAVLPVISRSVPFFIIKRRTDYTMLTQL